MPVVSAAYSILVADGQMFHFSSDTIIYTCARARECMTGPDAKNSTEVNQFSQGTATCMARERERERSHEVGLSPLTAVPSQNTTDHIVP